MTSRTVHSSPGFAKLQAVAASIAQTNTSKGRGKHRKPDPPLKKPRLTAAVAEDTAAADEGGASLGEAPWRDTRLSKEHRNALFNAWQYAGEPGNLYDQLRLRVADAHLAASLYGNLSQVYQGIAEQARNEARTAESRFNQAMRLLRRLVLPDDEDDPQAAKLALANGQAVVPVPAPVGALDLPGIVTRTKNGETLHRCIHCQAEYTGVFLRHKGECVIPQAEALVHAWQAFYGGDEG